MRLNPSKSLENLAYLAVIVVSVLLSIALVKRFILPQNNPTPPPVNSVVPPGSRISLPNTEWNKSSRTLVLAIATTCHFCTESGGFYRTLAARKGSTSSLRLIAVLPQTEQEGKSYLDKLGVSVDEVKQAQLSSIGVSATPTLIFVDNNGTVLESWVGKLTPDKEKEVLAHL